MVIGRSSPETAQKPHIDLAAFDAEHFGVSRAHASLKINNRTLVITDLQSSNSTYVNGQRVYPHEIRVLRHGDEIRLGRLPLKVLFKL
jgi:pSer/pThr/pTyr-binding forkhead associated (FHA) protein